MSKTADLQGSRTDTQENLQTIMVIVQLSIADGQFVEQVWAGRGSAITLHLTGASPALVPFDKC